MTRLSLTMSALSRPIADLVPTHGCVSHVGYHDHVKWYAEQTLYLRSGSHALADELLWDWRWRRGVDLGTWFRSPRESG